MQKLTAQEHLLRKIVSSDFALTIPKYQRPYQWSTDQTLQLLDKLEERLDRGDDEPYFVGSLMLAEQDDTAFDVISCWQRLTTLPPGEQDAAFFWKYVQEQGGNISALADLSDG